jgi:muramoyltetrapeptide carboxypeptidase LdcA involved in peptidoglycan recycling
MMKDFIIPERLKAGDRVAIVAPSSGAAAMFPGIYQQGLERMREVFGLEPVEFPTALKDGRFLAANPKARAEDINNAFADKSIKAVIATIGGNDQIKILDYLDKNTIDENPNMIMGLSDRPIICTSEFGNYPYYGGSVCSSGLKTGEWMNTQ